MIPSGIGNIIPMKYKAAVGLGGSILSFVIPLLVDGGQYLPTPWPAVIGAGLSVATAVGVYHAPYKPPATVLAPDTVEVAAAAAGTRTPTPPPPYRPGDPGGTYRNPWR